MEDSALLSPGRALFAVDPGHDLFGEVPDNGFLGGWPIDQEGRLGDFRRNPDYKPTPTALRMRAPQNDVERALQNLLTGHATDEAFLSAVRAAELLVPTEPDSQQLSFHEEADGKRVLNVYTSTDYAPDEWKHWQRLNALRLAQNLSGTFLRFNPGGNPGLRLPAVDVAVSEFG